LLGGLRIEGLYVQCVATQVNKGGGFARSLLESSKSALQIMLWLQTQSLPKLGGRNFIPCYPLNLLRKNVSLDSIEFETFKNPPHIFSDVAIKEPMNVVTRRDRT